MKIQAAKISRVLRGEKKATDSVVTGTTSVPHGSRLKPRFSAPAHEDDAYACMHVHDHRRRAKSTRSPTAMEREPSEDEPSAKRAKAEDEAPAAEDAPATEEAPAVEETGSTADAAAEEPAAEEAAIAPPAADTPATGQAGDAISNEELVELLKQRVEAKRMRDFVTSDTIRTTLEARGVHITDAKGQTQVGRWVALDGREGNTQGPDYFQQAPPAFGRGAALLVPQLAYPATLLRTAFFFPVRRFTLLAPVPRPRMLRLPTLRCRSQTRATRCRRRRRQATAGQAMAAHRHRSRSRRSPGRGWSATTSWWRCCGTARRPR